jgi:hypothetical protein
MAVRVIDLALQIFIPSFLTLIEICNCHLMCWIALVGMSRAFSWSPTVTRDTNWTASVVWWSEFLATDPEVRVRFPALPDFLRSGGSGIGSTQPREYN